MEAASCADILKTLHHQPHVDVLKLCVDDDASTRQAVRWNNADYLRNNNTDALPQVPKKSGKNKGELQDRPDKGLLPGCMMEPECASDPNHRKKLLTGELCDLQEKTVAQRQTMTKMDYKRIGKNFGYMARSLPGLPEHQHCQAASAVLEHHFDNHEFCGNWCPRKRLSKEQQQQSERYYRCKTKDAKLYETLSKIIAKHITPERLKDIAHGMDTNVNEALNNIISYFAPKNRTHCATRSLHNRIAMAIGIHSLGFMPYFERLFAALGITITNNVRHFLETRNRMRVFKITKRKTPAEKKRRLKRKNEELRKNEQQAKKERATRDGCYKPGGNMAEGGFDGMDVEQQEPTKKGPRICPHCGKKGHSTTRSKKCLQHKDNLATKQQTASDPISNAVPEVPASSADQDAADDIDDYDAMPFDSDELPGMDVDNQNEFFDCGTWSEDEDGVMIVQATI